MSNHEKIIGTPQTSAITSDEKKHRTFFVNAPHVILSASLAFIEVFAQVYPKK